MHELPGTLLLHPTVLDNPYPFYRQLRAEAPVWMIPGTAVFTVSTFELVAEAAGRVEDFSSNMRCLLYRDEAGLPGRFEFGDAAAQGPRVGPGGIAHGHPGDDVPVAPGIFCQAVHDEIGMGDNVYLGDRNGVELLLRREAAQESERLGEPGPRGLDRCFLFPLPTSFPRSSRRTGLRRPTAPRRGCRHGHAAR